MAPKPKPDYAVDPETGCWVWLKQRIGKGYGRKWTGDAKNTNGKTGALAHRYYYELLVGPIPDGLQIDHLCLNKACVNPEHMEVVTGLENRRRASVVTPEGVRHVRAEGMGCVDAARFLGVSEAAASKIVRGLSWRDV